MKNDQFAVYRVDRHSEGRDLWHLSYQEAVSRKLAIRIEYYRQMDIRPLLPGESAIALWKRMKESCEVSDVLVLNQNGEIHCYYVNEDYPQLLSGFIRLNPSGTLVTLDTENYRISGKPGNWMATDDMLWSSIFVTLMANKIGGLQFGIYRNCQISSRVFHTAVAALPLTKANRSDFE